MIGGRDRREGSARGTGERDRREGSGRGIGERDGREAGLRRTDTGAVGVVDSVLESTLLRITAPVVDVTNQTVRYTTCDSAPSQSQYNNTIQYVFISTYFVHNYVQHTYLWKMLLWKMIVLF